MNLLDLYYSAIEQERDPENKDWYLLPDWVDIDDMLATLLMTGRIEINNHTATGARTRGRTPRYALCNIGIDGIVYTEWADDDYNIGTRALRKLLIALDQWEEK